MTTRQIQDALDLLDYGPIDNDGVSGPATQEAVRRFQRQEGLEEDGIPGPLTEPKLREAVAVWRVYKPPGTAKDTTAAADAAQYLRSDGCYHIPRGVDVQLTKNFWAHEIHCQGVGCCTESVISKRIMDLAQDIRDDIGEPLAIGDAKGSGYRCKTHNAEVGGAATSLHMISDAVDLHYRDPPKLKKVAQRHLKDGEIGLYDWGCHVGRWDRGYVSEFYK